MAGAVILRSAFDADAVTVSFEVLAERDVAAGWRLAFTSVVQLTPVAGARLVDRLATYHVVEPDPPVSLTAGEPWQLSGCTAGHAPTHANDGPVSAYLILPDGSTATLTVEPMTATGTAVPSLEPGPGATVAAGATPTTAPAIVPMPRHVEHGRAPLDASTVRLADGPGDARLAWTAVARLAERATGDERLTDDGAPVTAVLDPGLGDPDAEAYRIEIAGGSITVTAAGRLGFLRAFVTLAQWAHTGMPSDGVVDDRPAHGWRGLHIDLARQWFDPAVVGRLIDLAAWRKLSRLHLHLTDDEGWRLPVTARPQLGDAGARRGHARPLPPMLGGGPEPVGRAYTPDEIAEWVRRADDLGVTLVPEVDMPGHMHAALVALPHLRDPDDASGATSVQFFTDNVLVPGLPATDGFLDEVLAAVTELFPHSPWVHVGGDEVPEGAWRGSPVVRGAYPDHRTSEIESAFHASLVERLRDHRRSVAVWQEAAECGGVTPGDGIVMCWRTVAASRELAARGHTVVVTPGQAYYLDMALDDGWETPGASWAASTSLDDVVAFDPVAGWTPEERRHLAGIQACLWTEHVADEAAVHERLGRRLDAIAERAWTGDVVGGSASIAHRGDATAYRVPGLSSR